MLFKKNSSFIKKKLNKYGFVIIKDFFNDSPEFINFKNYLNFTLQKVAKAVSLAFDGIDYNVILNNGVNAGQVVEHLHFHVIPRSEGSSGPFRKQIQYAEREIQEIGEKIRNCF